MTCESCGLDFEKGAECMCPIYTKLMEEGRYREVPLYWQKNVWVYPLYCPSCKSEYWPGDDCDCVIFRLNASTGLPVPSWWTDKP